MLKMKELTDFFLRPAIDFTLPVNPSFSVFRDQSPNLDVKVVRFLSFSDLLNHVVEWITV